MHRKNTLGITRAILVRHSLATCLLAAVAAILAVSIVMAMTGLIAIHGWDWSVGTNTHYCGAYLPHLDFYCEVAS